MIPWKCVFIFYLKTAHVLYDILSHDWLTVVTNAYFGVVFFATNKIIKYMDVDSIQKT